MKTIGKGIVPIDRLAGNLPLYLALVAAFSACSWVVLATYWKMPISTSHSIVGAVAGAGLAVLLFAVLFFVIIGTTWPVGQTIDTSNLIPQIGTELVTTYVLPFEAASLLLLAVLIGSIVIARE